MKMDKLLKQAQRMQAQMASLQEELAKVAVEGTSGGGMVRASVNGHGDLLSLKIAPEVIDPQEPEMLEDLVLSAVNEAIRKSKDQANGQVNQLTGGMSFPGF